MRRSQGYLIAGVCLLLTACGGSSDDPAQTAPFTLSVTDMPLNSLAISEVCIDFNRITLHYAGDQDVMLDYRPAPSEVSSVTHCGPADTWDGALPAPPLRLDALNDTLSVALAESLQIPLGRVTWIRLHFTGGSYIMHNDGAQFADIRCPSCDVTDNNDGRGFKLVDTFNVDENGLVLMVDIDMRRSFHQDANGYVMRPTARVDRSDTTGVLVGEVDSGLIPAEGGMLFTGADMDTGCAAYIYQGHMVDPDDVQDPDPVFRTAVVRFREATGLYTYATGLPGGTEAVPMPYTVALTCDADDPMANDENADDMVAGHVIFTPAQDANVIAGQTTRIDFPAPPVPVL